MAAKEMFEKIGWSYEYVKGENCEDAIRCKDLTRTMLLTNPSDFNRTRPNIQFNLISKDIVIDDLMFISIPILQAMNKQAEELGWSD